MKAILKKLIGEVFFTVAALALCRSQSAITELHVDDIRAQQPQEKLAASPLCRQAFESPKHGILQRTSVDPNTLIQDLGTLMERSDEVVLTGVAYRGFTVFAPSGESVTTYYDVKIIRSWKGTHEVGDTLTFGVPAGAVHCGWTDSRQSSVYVSTMKGTNEWQDNLLYDRPTILFLRRPNGNETQLVQTLLPATGGGLQGIFSISLPVSDYKTSNKCASLKSETLKWCDSYRETSQYPVVAPYVPDP